MFVCEWLTHLTCEGRVCCLHQFKRKAQVLAVLRCTRQFVQRKRPLGEVVEVLPVTVWVACRQAGRQAGVQAGR